MSFQASIERVAKRKNSRVVLALDFPFQEGMTDHHLLSRAEETLENVQPYICAVKLNRHLALPLGVLDGVRRLVERVHDMNMMTIMDCKINDIGATNRTIAEYYFNAGFDAVIANPFVGWEEGLGPVFDVARRLQRGVILLVYMSHKGTWEGYGQTVHDAQRNKNIPQYVSFAQKALSWGADGVIVGATFPERVREVREIVGEEIPILSPGIGAQGGVIKLALDAGSNYLIVGRTITLSEDQRTAAREIRDMANQVK